MSAKFLIIKRGLYYRPQAKGYTNFKEEAGRFTLEEVAVRFPNKDSDNQDGMYFMHEDDSPEYAPSCCPIEELYHRRRKEQG
jgi:hypothetical protein